MSSLKYDPENYIKLLISNFHVIYMTMYFKKNVSEYK